MTHIALRSAPPPSLLLLPALLPQLLWVKRRIPRLPEAAGTVGEVAGSEPGLRLLVVGDSMAAGVGVVHHKDSLAGQLAERLARETQRSVAWRVIARSGATAMSTRRKIAKGPIGFDDARRPQLAVVIVGINDLLRYSALRIWRRDLNSLVAALRQQVGAEVSIAFAGMPPVGRFPALPQPLRAILGTRARRMDRALRESAEGSGAFYVSLPIHAMAGQPHAFFAQDRFHPSARGYSEVAAAFLPVARTAVEHADPQPDTDTM